MLYSLGPFTIQLVVSFFFVFSLFVFLFLDLVLVLILVLFLIFFLILLLVLLMYFAPEDHCLTLALLLAQPGSLRLASLSSVRVQTACQFLATKIDDVNFLATRPK